ncbi:hypothetical protein RG28_26975 (plasmid) [Escherichia coli]|nr:hypothetical protein RG28_26975 [Escherichia coli]
MSPLPYFFHRTVADEFLNAVKAGDFSQRHGCTGLPAGLIWVSLDIENYCTIRVSVGISAITPAKLFLPDGNHLFFVQRLVRRIFILKNGVFICGKRCRIVELYDKLTSDAYYREGDR